jgi:hypothetical protein
VEKQFFERSEMAGPAGLGGAHERRTIGDGVKIIQGEAEQFTVQPAGFGRMGDVPGIIDRQPVCLEDRCPLTEARRP